MDSEVGETSALCIMENSCAVTRVEGVLLRIENKDYSYVLLTLNLGLLIPYLVL